MKDELAHSVCSRTGSMAQLLMTGRGMPGAVSYVIGSLLPRQRSLLQPLYLVPILSSGSLDF